MSEGPKGESFGSIEQAFSVVEKKSKKTEESSQVVVPEKIKKRRETKSKQEKKPKEDLRGYDVVDLEDQLVEDPELKKVGSFVDESIAESRESGEEEKYFREINDQIQFEEKVQAQFKESDTLKNNRERISKVKKIIEDLPEAHEILDKDFPDFPEEKIVLPEITAEQFQEGVRYKNIEDYDATNSEKEIEEDYFSGFNNKTRLKRNLRRKIADTKFKKETQSLEEPVKEKEIKPKETKEKKLKTAIEIAIEKTQGIADEYNEKKLKSEDITNARNLDELFELIEKSEGIQGSQEYFDKDKLKMIIEMVNDGELGYEYITRSGGLRQKVYDLLNTKKEKTKKKKEEVVSEQEKYDDSYIPEDTEQITELPEDKISGEVLNFNEENKRAGITKDGKQKVLNEEYVIQPNSENNKVVDLERSVERARKNYINNIKTFNKIGEELAKQTSVKSIFKKFLAKIRREPSKIDIAKERMMTAEKNYHKSLDDVLNILIQQKYDEVLSMRANNSERKKYEKVYASDIFKFMQLFINKPITKEFRNFLDSKDEQEIDLKEIEGMNVLSKSEIDQLKKEVIFAEIKKEIYEDLKKKEEELLGRGVN